MYVEYETMHAYIQVMSIISMSEVASETYRAVSTGVVVISS